MAETPSSSSMPSVTIGQKRPLEDEHAPQVSSPLNPDPPAKGRGGKEKAPMHREPREKKESLKKREAKASSVPAEARGTPDRSVGHGAKTPVTPAETAVAPLRYKLPPPRTLDYQVPKGPVLTPHSLKPVHGGEVRFYESSEHVYNRKGFRYTHCIADPTFTSSLFYRQSETEPFHPRINYEDTSSHILVDQSARQVTTEKGFRMARANVGVREGRWYWECRITSGIRPRPDGTAMETGGGRNANGIEEPRGHVRLGWARREASLDAPVGFDAYSYGLRDVAGQKMHMSRPKDFFPPGEDIREGDVIGVEINLPSLALHRKIVHGQYNPAVDVTEDAAAQGQTGPDTIRDRVPIHYKAHLYFEQFEYHSTKELEELMNPSATATGAPANGALQHPNPIHATVALRTLPQSWIKVYRNGRYMGTPFTNLLAFLPPASRPLTQVGARDGLDDGMLGYFPAISVFRGGAAEANFGPDFWYHPPDDEDVEMTDAGAAPSLPPRRPVGERYNEQIAEDVTYDLVDEAEFWLQDGGSTDRAPGLNEVTPPAMGSGLPASSTADVAMADAAHSTGEIKELVQEEE
ncbi:MAG: hypothetical protein M1838_001939 [Thelocarpon superellum]|nr:MAG: hypothetical protein M1838_001939 [Thelocarpon superellum]